MTLSKQCDNEFNVTWPAGDFSRVPFEVFFDPDIYKREQEKVFRGETWNYLCLEAELPETGNYLLSSIGDTPIIVTRNEQGEVAAMVNRCKHRAAAVCREKFGKTDSLICVYHQWSYDLSGNLTGVPFRRGIKKAGGMPKDFDPKDHGLDKVRVEVYGGLVFGTFSDKLTDVAGYLGPRIVKHLEPILNQPLKVLGHHKQVIKSNWKVYTENSKDAYHASLLHLFHATFGLFRSTEKGGVDLSEDFLHSVAYSRMGSDDDEALNEAFGETRFQKIEVDETEFSLADPSVLKTKQEFEDGWSVMIFSLFPSLVFQRIGNTFVTRKIIPLGPDKFELYWTHFGYADEDEELTALRLKQANLIGPAGLISMEDGEASEIVQRSVRSGSGQHSVIEMGGIGEIEPQEHLVTEVPIRGLWKTYHRMMDFAPAGNAEQGENA